MQTKWIFSSTFLPYTGEPIEFLLEEREQPIHGTFANGMFHSRWADYDADCVASWRESDDDPSTASIAISTVRRTSAFTATLRRIVRILFRDRNAAPIVAPRSRVRTTATPEISMPPIVITKSPFDSNQIST